MMSFKSGDVIVGKWKGERILLHRRLGSGTHGTVYLAEWNQHPVAIKIGTDAVTISSEINRLRALNQMPIDPFGPHLLSYDDLERAGRIFPFYLMTYLAGDPLHEVLQGKKRGGTEWVWVILQILDHLQDLHREGYVYGDWKPQHLVVDGTDGRVRFVDPGGITPMGHPLRQWTELYDRGTWHAGLRVADPGYDLFAVTMLILCEVMALPLGTIKDDQRYPRTLCDIIRNKTTLPPAFRDLFIGTVQGDWKSAHDYARALTQAAGSSIKWQPPSQQHFRQVLRERVWECCFVSSAGLFLAILYLFVR